MVDLFANSGDPDQTPRSAESDLGLHCLQVTGLRYPVFNGLKESVRLIRIIVYFMNVYSSKI